MYRLKIGIGLVLLSAPAISQDNTPMTEEEKPWFLKEAWMQKNAPNGIDITPDSKVWISMNKSIDGDEYAISAEDYEVREYPYAKAWLRGYHKANRKVNYRESRSLYHFDCIRKTYFTSYQQTYRADRSVLSVVSSSSAVVPIVPGSIAETWSYFFCRPK